jgi:hypothetical protein
LIIKFRKPFGTAHSVSTSRVNAEFYIKIENKENKNEFYEGKGECGLPPKKAKCYLADYSDCEESFENFKKILSSGK